MTYSYFIILFSNNISDINMGRMTSIKWEKSMPCKPVHNIISSDFPKYNPQTWKYMEGEPQIQLILSYEYQRMWLQEREAWKKRMYAENDTVNIDVVKRYVLNLKNHPKPDKRPTNKLLFNMKKFDGIRGKVTTKRSPDDRVTAHNNNKKNDK